MQQTLIGDRNNQGINHGNRQRFQHTLTRRHHMRMANAILEDVFTASFAEKLYSKI
ncbi:hypothetical protein [Methylomonas sp. AM2-LC]|uniref:hypothetical protein n=1 Tax=Methylomonas sp. AM2-LC TaxID=3153301 RepID=UPI0032632E84